MAFKKRERHDEPRDITQGKIYIVFDWIWKLFVINVLTILTSLGVITFLPAIVSAFRTLKDCKEEDETHYIRAYYQNFVFCFKDSVLMGILWLFVFALFFYAYIYYSAIIDNLAEDGNYQGWLNLYSIMLGLTAIFFLLTFLIFVQLPKVITYFHLRFFDKIRISFYMTFRYFARWLLEFLVMFANIVIIYYTSYIWFFTFGLSIPIYFGYLIGRKPYWALSNHDEYKDEEDEFDIKGQSQNRETYEDNSDEERMKIQEEELRKINEMNGED